MKTLTRNAYAKVNLALDVLRRREDGYHDVCMIMQNLSLYDTLTFTVKEADTLTITLACDKAFVPCDARNLIYKAIALMGETYHLTGHVHVELVKRIPVEAGMAGGSTDCAAAFHAMRELYGLDVSDQELMKLGVKLGADVPYCIMAKTALSEGIGEVLTEVAPLPDCFVVVAKPTISVSTKMVYENLHANELQHHPDVAGAEAGRSVRCGKPHGKCLGDSHNEALSADRGDQTDNERVWCRKCDHERQRTDGVWFIYRESDCRAGGRENPAAVRTFRGICDTAVLELAEIFAES